MMAIFFISAFSYRFRAAFHCEALTSEGKTFTPGARRLRAHYYLTSTESSYRVKAKNKYHNLISYKKYIFNNDLHDKSGVFIALFR